MGLIWVLVGLAVTMFIAGFLEPDKVKSAHENRALASALYLLGVLLFLPNRAGAVARRALRQLKRV